jgi:glycosyltransferase involved in cell wall biosynthesis
MSPPIKLNLHIYPSFLTNESRILREVKSLIKLGLVQNVAVIGYHRPGLSTVETIAPNITFYRIKPIIAKQSGQLKFLNMLSFATFYFQIVRFCMKNRPAIINAHSLTVLPLGALLKSLWNGKLIYDAHELETETNESKGIRKKIAKKLESFFIRKADHVIVVGELIRKWYLDAYHIKKISVIKNIPESTPIFKQNTLLRKKLKLTQGEILFLYVGSLEYGRGISLLLKVFEILDRQYHLAFMGYGSYTDLIKKISVTRSNIHYIDAVPVSEVLDLISGADVGICLIENTCLSYYYCLPNKSFEYLAAGIPFISSDFPELVNEFKAKDVCWFASLETDALIKLIKAITPDVIDNKRQNVINTRSEWQWKHEEKEYLQIFGNI